ncbi:hypothetical protein SB7C_12220, partial [Staphylococcus epidermidis]
MRDDGGDLAVGTCRSNRRAAALGALFSAYRPEIFACRGTCNATCDAGAAGRTGEIERAIRATYVVPAKAGTHCHKVELLRHAVAPARETIWHSWLWVPAFA